MGTAAACPQEVACRRRLVEGPIKFGHTAEHGHNKCSKINKYGFSFYSHPIHQ
jgi:hypothetical protein